MNKMKIGAIRWDAWVGDKNPVGLEVEKTMRSTYAKKRYPFYASNLKGNLHIVKILLLKKLIMLIVMVLIILLFVGILFILD